MIVFLYREWWLKYIRDMAQQGQPWRDFTPIVFQAVQMHVALAGEADAVAAVATATAKVLDPIDNRIELLTGDD